MERSQESLLYLNSNTASNCDLSVHNEKTQVAFSMKSIESKRKQKRWPDTMEKQDQEPYSEVLYSFFLEKNISRHEQLTFQQQSTG